jgi:L-asparaginase
MRPAKFKDSDAPLNIGAAISTVQLLKPGIYIAMNGIIADVNNTQRENLTGQFIKDL